MSVAKSFTNAANIQRSAAHGKKFMPRPLAPSHCAIFPKFPDRAMEAGGKVASSGGKGTRLGLSISYGIIKRFGGDVQVESVQGRGTTVRVRLREVRREG